MTRLEAVGIARSGEVEAAVSGASPAGVRPVGARRAGVVVRVGVHLVRVARAAAAPGAYVGRRRSSIELY